MPKMTTATIITTFKPAAARQEHLRTRREIEFDQLDTTSVLEDDSPFNNKKSPVNYIFKSNSNIKNGNGRSDHKGIADNSEESHLLKFPKEK